MPNEAFVADVVKQCFSFLIEQVLAMPIGRRNDEELLLEPARTRRRAREHVCQWLLVLARRAKDADIE